MLGALDIAVLPEASGIEIQTDGSRLHVMNDGRTPIFAYADNGRAIIYTTESVQGSPAPVFRQTCR